MKFYEAVLRVHNVLRYGDIVRMASTNVQVGITTFCASPNMESF